jgi:hypothetical protein
VVVGSGQTGNCSYHRKLKPISKDERKGCEVLLKPTPKPVARKEDRSLSRDLWKEMPCKRTS